LTEDINANEWELETEQIKFEGPVRIKAQLSRITNAVDVEAVVSAVIIAECGRCLEKIRIDFDKKLRFDYEVTGSDQVIDLKPDIREEIIVSYPLRTLCRPDCKGLCSKCGKNLNNGNCGCQ